MNNHTLNDLERNCLLHMNQNGIFFDGPIQLDGNIHRFSRDMNKKKRMNGMWPDLGSFKKMITWSCVMDLGVIQKLNSNINHGRMIFIFSHSIEESMALQQHLKEINLAYEKRTPKTP
ncbi:MAG: hypothetical protein H7A37_03980 [Chlamydiales bacterium]|nr:hypothetical protein [Chlamydiales bacterium]